METIEKRLSTWAELIVTLNEYETDNERKAAVITRQEQEIARLQRCVRAWERRAEKLHKELNEKWECIIDTERRANGR